MHLAANLLLLDMLLNVFSKIKILAVMSTGHILIFKVCALNKLIVIMIVIVTLMAVFQVH